MKLEESGLINGDHRMAIQDKEEIQDKNLWISRGGLLKPTGVGNATGSNWSDGIVGRRGAAGIKVRIPIRRRKAYPPRGRQSRQPVKRPVDIEFF